MASNPFLRQSRDKGQVALETAFVFSTLIFLTFAIMNIGILFHTKMIATYAAFMAGRSYQVFGDQTGASYFEEMKSKSISLGGGAKSNTLLGDTGKTVTAFRVAEDIFTCSLPWMTVPQGDGTASTGGGRDFASRCQEGKRKYENTNIGRVISFAPFEKDASSMVKKATQLNEVTGGFSEKNRKPLRYGIMSIKYRMPILFNPYGAFGANGEEPIIRDEVFVPVLLNPGLSEGLKEADKSKKDFDDDFKSGK